MRKLLERTILSAKQRLVLLAPPGQLPSHFTNVQMDTKRHASRFREMQALRGGVYLRDGAVQPYDLTSDGLHKTPEDGMSWHVLMLDHEDKLSSCIWYMEHDNTVGIEDLRAHECPLGLRAETRDKFRNAVHADLEQARREKLKYAESGGWAVAEGNRCGTEGLVLALAAFSLGNLSGGVLALSTATSRHCSSTILQRLGGSALMAHGEPLPAYFDPKYKCEMDLLRFDSRRPNPKYAGLVALLEEKLKDVMVLANPAVTSVASPSKYFIAPAVARAEVAAA